MNKSNKWIMNISVVVVQLILFVIFYYLVGFFVGVYTEQFLHDESEWQLYLVLSVHMTVCVFVFYYIGALLSKLSVANNQYSDMVFAGIVFISQTVMIIQTDIAREMKAFLWEFPFGWAIPVYDAVQKIVGDDINRYKYILITYWFVISLAIFIGLRKKYVMSERREDLKRIWLSFIVVMVIIINASTLRNMLTPRLFHTETYPKIDGATAAIPLGQVLAQNLLGKDALEAQHFVNFNTTHDAYVNLIQKDADIIFVAEPSKEELTLAEQQGVRLKCTPIGTDAFVFIVNKENPVDGLTIQQIRDIYSGKVKNWREVGGKDEEIIAYQRPQNSGSQTIMENIVMRNISMMDAPSEHRPGGMSNMLEVLDYKNASNALGYSVYYFANVMNKKENIKFLSINDVPCNKETIATKSYPFSGPIYAVTRESDETENTKKLLAFLLGVEGQRLIEEGGFVPISDGSQRN